MSQRIRIVSDLHLGHRASVLADLEAMRPLAEDVDLLVFNGDTLELKYGDMDASTYNAPDHKARFEQEVASWQAKTLVITGNHDPSISETHYADLCGGAVFVTHGDGLFREIAPWSSNVKNLRQRSASIDPEQTGKPEELHGYLQRYKQATLEAHELDRRYNPTAWGKAKIFLHQAWPPLTPFRILRCWRQMPDRAVSLASRFGFHPRFLVIGHTHNPGIWRRGEQTVINLGSFFPWPGARCVDIADGALRVRSIRKGRNCLRIDKTLASFALDASPSRRTGTSSALREPSIG